MTVVEIIAECKAEMMIADINMEAAAADGCEAEEGFWRGRRSAYREILDLIFADGEG